MKKILFAVFMFAAVPVFAGVSSYFPYGLKASTITVTGQSTLSSTTVNGTLGITGSAVSVNGVAYTMPASQGSANQYLANNGAGSLTWTTPTSGGDVYQTGNNTMSGTNNFTGTVQVNGSTAAIPTVMYANPSGAYSSTFSFTCNGVYRLTWDMTMGSTDGQIFVNFNSSSTGHHALYYTMNSGNAVGMSAQWNNSSLIYLNFGGNNIAASAPATGTATINCMDGSYTMLYADFLSNDSDGNWNSGWTRGLYTSGHPTSLYVKTTQPASGKISLIKVSD